MYKKVKSKSINSLLSVFLAFALILSNFFGISGINTAFAGDGSKNNPYNVEEALTKQGQKAVTVEGYIIGEPVNFKKIHFDNFSGDAALAIADSVSETNPEKVIYLKLDKRDYKDNFGLKSHPENKGKKIRFTGEIGIYHKPHIGVVGITDIEEVRENNNPNRVDYIKSNPPQGTVAEGTEVQLSTNTEGAVIYFTEDGKDISVETTSSAIKYTKPIVINEDKTIKAIAVKAGMEPSEVSIFDYKLIGIRSIKEARNLPKDSKAIIEGIVTAVFGDKIYLQDNTAGIVLDLYKLDAGDKNISVGDKLNVQGNISEYKGLQQIKPTSKDFIKVVEKNLSLPKPITVKASDLQANVGEEFEGRLVKINNIEIQSVDEFGNNRVNDSTGECVVSNKEKWVEVGEVYKNVIGVVTYNHDEYKIIPRTIDDVVKDNSIVSIVKANFISGEVEIGKEIELRTATPDAKIYYTIDGTEPNESSLIYKEPIKVEKDLIIKAFAAKQGLKSSKISTFDYKAIAPRVYTEIHDIQGAGHISPMVGQNVNIRGIVTAAMNDKFVKGYYVQSTNPDNDDRTSEAIYCYNFNEMPQLKAGDMVAISGEIEEATINEFKEAESQALTTTKIVPSRINIESRDNKLPEPVILGKGGRQCPTKIIDNDNFQVFDPEEDAIDFYESLEGMLVKVNNPLIVGQDERYGEIWVLSDEGEASKEKKSSKNGVVISRDNFNPEVIDIDDIIHPITNPKTKEFIDPNFKIKVGDKFNDSVTGVVSYALGKYKVYNTEKLPEVIDGGNTREITDIVPVEDKLNVATYNIENFSPLSGERINKVAETIVTNLKSPDILSLIEVEDNNGEKGEGVTDASESYKVLIKAIKSLGGPEYAFTDIAPVNGQDGGVPGGNIRNGFIYRTDRVKLVEKKKGDSVTEADYNENGLVVNPSRLGTTHESFKSCRKSLVAEFEFKGQRFIAIANHLSSKRGDTSMYGVTQPPVLGSEAKRIEQAQLINDFVKKVKSVNKDANVLVMGDMNDFEFSDTLIALKGNELTNMIEELPKNERFTYQYQGNSQVLDNLLVSNNLKDKAIVDVVHINSMFIKKQGRVSDHDPVLIQIDINGTTPTKPEQPAVNGIKLEMLTSQEELSKLKVGDSAEIKVKATNVSDKNKNVSVIVASYNKDNHLINYVKATQEIEVNKNSILEGSIKLIEGTSKVKVFIWDDVNGMNPLNDVIEVEVK